MPYSTPPTRSRLVVAQTTSLFKEPSLDSEAVTWLRAGTTIVSKGEPLMDTSGSSWTPVAIAHEGKYLAGWMLTSYMGRAKETP